MTVPLISPTVLLIFTLAGIWLSRRDCESLRRELTDNMNRQFGEVNRQFTEVNRRLTLIESDQKQFFVFTGKL